MSTLLQAATSSENRAAWLATGGAIVEPHGQVPGYQPGRPFVILNSPLPGPSGRVYPVGSIFHGRLCKRRRDVRPGVYLVQMVGRTVVGYLSPSALADAQGQRQAWLQSPVGPLPLYFEWADPTFSLLEIEETMVPVD